MSKPGSISKSELAQAYGISVETLRTWIEPFLAELKKKYGYKKDQKIFTIAQRDFIYEKLGRP